MQTITVTVPARPTRAGVDPRFLLVDWATADNVHTVTVTN
jgi:ABC-2 type transport system permease protein